MSPRGARRRLAAVEDRLAPSGVVLRWLAELKAHGSLAAYSDALAQEPGGLDLLGRFLELLEPAVERMPSAGSGYGGHLARRRATRQALFRLFLVIRLNLHAARRAPLRTVTALATSYQLDALLAGQPDEQRRSDNAPEFERRLAHMARPRRSSPDRVVRGSMGQSEPRGALSRACRFAHSRSRR